MKVRLLKVWPFQIGLLTEIHKEFWEYEFHCLTSYFVTKLRERKQLLTNIAALASCSVWSTRPITQLI